MTKIQVLQSLEFKGYFELARNEARVLFVVSEVAHVIDFLRIYEKYLIIKKKIKEKTQRIRAAIKLF